MRAIPITCKQCGYKTTKLESELQTNECPICGAKNSLGMDKSNMNDLLEQEVLNHILKGFKDFGIEATIESIEKHLKNRQKEYYIDVINKYFKGLNKCFTKS